MPSLVTGLNDEAWESVVVPGIFRQDSEIPSECPNRRTVGLFVISICD